MLLTELSSRDQIRAQFVMSALDDRFGWTMRAQGNVTPLGVHGGHFNIHFSIPENVVLAKMVLGNTVDDHVIPPGYRFPPAKVKGADGNWTLHVVEIYLADPIQGIAHLDKGDPQWDGLGLFEHIFCDGLGGHLDGDIDPRPVKEVA